MVFCYLRVSTENQTIENQRFEILKWAKANDIKVIALKEKFEMRDNINSKVLAFAFSLSAKIERVLISQRTKEALARKKAEGVTLGRPKGAKTRIECHPCFHAREQILIWDKKGLSYSRIAKKLGVHRDTLRRWFILSGNECLLRGRNY